jgi:hypothetical protein
MWRLFENILHIICGKPDEMQEGFGFEYLSLAVVAI